jgi:hypothetical protein
MDVVPVILIFGLIAILFDGVWSVVAKTKGYSYSKGAWVSSLIFAFAGGVAMKNGNFYSGFIAGIGVAAIDATVGWWVSWVIGPGRLPEKISKSARTRAIVKAIIFVLIMGALLGMLGAFVASKI